MTPKNLSILRAKIKWFNPLEEFTCYLTTQEILYLVERYPKVDFHYCVWVDPKECASDKQVDKLRYLVSKGVSKVHNVHFKHHKSMNDILPKTGYHDLTRE